MSPLGHRMLMIITNVRWSLVRKNIDFRIWNSPEFKLFKSFDRFFERDTLISEHSIVNFNSVLLSNLIFNFHFFFFFFKESVLVKGFYLKFAKKVKCTTQEMKFSIKDFFSKCDQIQMCSNCSFKICKDYVFLSF